MSHPLLGAGYEVNPANGEWVNSEYRRIGELINDHWPTLFLAEIKPKDRETAEDHMYPYAVIQELENGQTVVIFVLREDELDERVLDRIYDGDPTKHDILKKIEFQNNVRDLLVLKRKQDEIEQMKDFARTVLKSPLHSYKHNGVRYD